jgi:hypothetical protein
MPSFMGDSTTGNSRSREQRIPTGQLKDGLYERSSIFEMQPTASSNGPRTNSRHLLPLSYLDAPKQAQARHGVRRMSIETSVSSSAGSGDSTSPTTEGEPPPHVEHVVANRAESREGLVMERSN